jgi:hypothetical protein
MVRAGRGFSAAAYAAIRLAIERFRPFMYSSAMRGKITFHDGYWYCYANSAAMLLSAGGEQISPRLIEVLSGVGLGAFVSREGLPFFSGRAGTPDMGISQALSTLGFAFTEAACEAPDAPPFDRLQAALATSPVAVGPLDMSFLSYNPGRPGVDHYVLVDRMEDDRVTVYDPAGYGAVFLGRTELADAWRADAIGYRRGHYRSWSHARRIASPSEDEIAAKAIGFFRSRYAEAARCATDEGGLIDERAIAWLAELVRRDGLTPGQRGHLLHFALPLGTKRALDFAGFFDERNSGLSQLKRLQAGRFGACVTHLMRGDDEAAAGELDALAEIESGIRDAVIAL